MGEWCVWWRKPSWVGFLRLFMFPDVLLCLCLRSNSLRVASSQSWHSTHQRDRHSQALWFDVLIMLLVGRDHSLTAVERLLIHLKSFDWCYRMRLCTLKRAYTFHTPPSPVKGSRCIYLNQAHWLTHINWIIGLHSLLSSKLHIRSNSNCSVLLTLYLMCCFFLFDFSSTEWKDKIIIIQSTATHCSSSAALIKTSVV